MRVARSVEHRSDTGQAYTVVTPCCTQCVTTASSYEYEKPPVT